MKVSKVFGCVIGFHVCVAGLILVQGCRTTQLPTTYNQDGTVRDESLNRSVSLRPVNNPVTYTTSSDSFVPAPRVESSSNSGPNWIVAERVDVIPETTSYDYSYQTSTVQSSSNRVEPEFNAGYETSYTTSTINNDFGDIAPIQPIQSRRTRSTVDYSQPPVPELTVPVTGSSFETYTVKRGDNLWSVAKRYSVSLNDLYAANGLNKNSVLSIGQQLQIPVEGGVATIQSVQADVYQPSSLSAATTQYVVKRGDSLSKIAAETGSTVRAIKAANNLNSDLIRLNQTLYIPSASGGTSPSIASSSSQFGNTSSVSGFNAVASSQPVTTYQSSGNSQGRTHTVQAGEFPATIARRYGMTAGELLAINGITDPRRLQVGQVLQVASSGSASNVDSRAVTVAPSSAQFSSSSSVSSSFAQKPVELDRAPTATLQPVDVTIIGAEPLVDGEMDAFPVDDRFEDGSSIPVIRLDN